MYPCKFNNDVEGRGKTFGNSCGKVFEILGFKLRAGFQSQLSFFRVNLRQLATLL